MLQIRDLACGYDRRTVLSGIDFSLRTGELLCLLGPNGVGKTTLFKTILGLLPPLAGDILLDGRLARQWSRREFARWLAYVPQAHTPPFPFQVRDVVAMGRVAHLGAFSAPGKHDKDIAASALETLGISSLAAQPYTEISGGERQLVLIARALAQESRILVMDEPTSNLDYGNQIRVMAQVRRVAADQGVSVILTTHYPNHAFQYAHRVLAIDSDRRYRLGPPEAAVTETYLRHTYGIETEIHQTHLRNGHTARMCVPCPADIDINPSTTLRSVAS